MSCPLGVVALGDSITNGGGELQNGVALQSWALWTARGLGLPYTGVATDGARAADVVARQLPAVEAQAGGRWDLGCLYVGVNDVRQADWDPVVFERDLAATADALAACAERVVMVTIPLDVGLPPAGAKVAEANAAIGRHAARHGVSAAGPGRGARPLRRGAGRALPARAGHGGARPQLAL